MMYSVYRSEKKKSVTAGEGDDENLTMFDQLAGSLSRRGIAATLNNADISDNERPN